MNLAFKYADLFASKGSPEELVEKIGTLKPPTKSTEVCFNRTRDLRRSIF